MNGTPTVRPYEIIRRLIGAGSRAEKTLITHGERVAEKALAIADRFSPQRTDREFLFEASLLHDIGMIATDAPRLGCFGSEPYIRHGILGREMLEKEGLPRHALVCERHFLTGVGPEEIRAHGLDLPPRPMYPVSWEEQLICFADCFFSKNPDRLDEEKSVERILDGLPEYSRPRFRDWLGLFRESEFAFGDGK